jgi:hypothetical protein
MLSAEVSFGANTECEVPRICLECALLDDRAAHSNHYPRS